MVIYYRRKANIVNFIPNFRRFQGPCTSECSFEYLQSVKISPTSQAAQSSPALRGNGVRSSGAVNLVLNIRAIGLGLDLASQRNIVELAVAVVLVSETLALRLCEANTTASSVRSLSLGGIGSVVRRDILRHPTNNTLRRVVVEVSRRLTSPKSTRSDLVIPETAATGAGVANGKGLAAGVLCAVARLTAYFGVLDVGDEGEVVVGCVGRNYAVEALEDAGLGRGISADGAGSAEAGEGGEGEELHDDLGMITLLWRFCLLCLRM
jgi:hypothetical protein